MTALLLLDTRNDKHYVSTSTIDLVLSTGRVVFNIAGRRIEVDGRADGVTIGHDYDHRELIRELAARALRVLCRDHGFVLYRSDI